MTQTWNTATEALAEDMFPLSFAQEAFWLLDQLETSSSFYNLLLSLRLAGKLDAKALQRSLDALLQRHEVLRASFVTVNGGPVQAMAAHLRLPLRHFDLSVLEQHARQKVARSLTIDALEKPFDLGRRPLLRAYLLQLAPNEHALMVIFPHILMDGWSTSLFLRDLGAFYTAFASGKPAQLPELPIQYADYAVWQRELLQGELLEQLATYWRQQLAGSPAMLELPYDHPRPAVSSHQGAYYLTTLATDLQAALHSLSRREGVTLFMTLLAAFQALLLRYSGQEDILVGTPIVGHTQPDLENVIGLFANTLVLRANLAGDPPFCVLLRRARDVCLGAYDHQDMPFKLLIDAIKPERSQSYSPFFQVLFALHNMREQPLAFAGLEVAPSDAAGATARFDLACDLLDTPRGILCRWEYSTALFEESTIARVAQSFQALLQAVVATPQQRLSQLPLLTEEERRMLLVSWNATQSPYPHNQCLHALVEAQARRSPDASALVYADQWLTYSALNNQADQLARYLHALGIEPEQLVGLYLERSIDLVVCALAVLKAGGAYVPLDPDYPPERLAFIAQHSQLAALLTQQSLAQQLPPCQCPVICVDTLWDSIAPCAAAEPDAAAATPYYQVGPANLAYVIFTSGSTGQPKGVQIPHRAVVNFMHAMRQRPGLSNHDVLLAVTSLSFDIAALELFLPLIVGARLEIIDRATALDGAQMAQHLRASGATVLQATPGTWRLLATAGWEGASTLKMLCGGEALPRELAYDLLKRGGALWNMYGPTETTIWSMIQQVQYLLEIPDQYAHVPLGVAIANTQLYILDAHWQLALVGVAGELYIGGEGLARGYLHRPDLTAERFIPHPFATTAGERLYRTGDRARLHADLTLEYLGRVDFQVKLRGYRIEPGEIEAILRQQPGVAEAVVIAREDQPGDRRLVAYVVAQADLALSPSSLRQALQQRLPDYMLPSAFVLLAALPLTPNGKVNRRALPAPTHANTEPHARQEPPRTAAEKILAAIWANVLGIEQVGIHDNFFALGGDSIRSLQMVTQAAEAGMLLSSRQLFQHQTVAQLASVAQLATIEPAGEQESSSTEAPLTPGQHSFFALALPEPHHWNQALLLEVRPYQAQPLDLELLQQAVFALLAHHDALRLRFMPGVDGWRQYIAPLEHALLRDIVRVVDLSMLPSSEQHDAIAQEAARAQASLNLALGPLMRIVYLTCGGKLPDQLFLTLHSLIADSFSWRILLEDLETACMQLARGEIIRLPPETCSFKTCATRLQASVQSQQARESAAARPHRDWSMMPALPIDFQLSIHERASANLCASARRMQRLLPSAETQTLLHELPNLYHNAIEEILLAALLEACASWIGAYRLLVAVEWFERDITIEGMDLSRTVGRISSPTLVGLDLEALADNTGSLPSAVALKIVKEQVRSQPLARPMSSGAHEFKNHSQPGVDICLRYHASGFSTPAEAAQRLFYPLQTTVGPLSSPQNPRPYLIELDCTISEGQLHMQWTYSERVHRTEAIEMIARNYTQALRRFIDHCQRPGVGGYTPSDFPEADLSQVALDKILARMRPGGKLPHQ